MIDQVLDCLNFIVANSFDVHLVESKGKEAIRLITDWEKSQIRSVVTKEDRSTVIIDELTLELKRVNGLMQKLFTEKGEGEQQEIKNLKAILQQAWELLKPGFDALEKSYQENKL